MESISYNPVEAYLKTTKLLCLILVLFVSITSGSIWARGGHGGGHHGGGHHFDGGHHFGGGHHYGGYGLGWGLGLGYGYDGYWPYYGGYYSPYYSGYGGNYPPVVYIQRDGDALAATESQSNYWHYCRNPKGYYPYVKKCPDGWLPVAPQPTTQ